MPVKKNDDKVVSSGPLDNFFKKAGASSKGKAKADSSNVSDDKPVSNVPAKRQPKRASTVARKKARVVSDEDSEVEIVPSKPVTKKRRTVISSDDSDIERAVPRRLLRKAPVVDSDSEPEIVSTNLIAGPSVISNNTAIELSSDENDYTLSNTQALKTIVKRGGRRHNEVTKRQVNKARNVKRRDGRQDANGAYQLYKLRKEDEKLPIRIEAYSSLLIEEFDTRLDNFLVIQAIHSDPSTTRMETVKSITNTTRAHHSAHEIPPDHALWDKLAPVQEFLKVFSDNPLEFNPAPFIADGTLVEDAPDGQSRREREKQVAEHDGYAKLYLRLYRIENGGAVLCDFCRQYPASAVHVIMMLVFLGWPLESIEKQMHPFLSVAGLGEVVTRLFDHIRQSRVSAVSTATFAGTTLWLPYFGLNIVGTPYLRSIFDDEETWTLLTNFLGLGQHNPPRVFVIEPLKVEVESAMDIRTNPLISFLEVALIAHGRGLTMNSHHGGWVPDYQPRQELLDAVLAIQIPTSSLTQPIHDAALISAANGLIDDEAQFWKTHYRNRNLAPPFVKDTIAEIKVNYSDCLATVENELPLLVVAKDITVEQLRGQVGGWNSPTAGLAIQEDRRIQRLLHNICSPGTSFQQIPFSDLFRMTPMEESEINIAYLSLLLDRTKPLVITTWGNAVSHSFRQKEVQSILECRDDSPPLFAQHVSSFLSGNRTMEVLKGIRDNVKDRHPIDWTERREGVFIDSLGMPGIIQYSPDPSSLSIEIPTFHPGSFKHDPLLAVTERELYFLIAAKVRLAKTLLIEDLYVNGRMQRDQPDVMENRLLGIMEAIETRCELTGFNSIFAALKRSHSSCSSAVNSLRMLASRLRGGCQRDSDTSSCSEEEEEDGEAAEMEDGSGKVATTNGLKAAVGREARAIQLKELRQEKEISLRRKIADPTAKYVPRTMDLDDSEYELWFMALRDGVVIYLARSAANRDIALADESPEQETQRLSVKTAIGLWSAKNKGNPEAFGYKPGDRIADLLRRAATALSTISQPSVWINQKRASNISEGWRAALCMHCRSWTVGEGQVSAHYCTFKKERIPITLDDDNYSRMVKLVFIHDIFGNDDLAPLVEAEPKDLGLISKSVSEVLSTPESRARSLKLFSLSTSINIAALEAAQGRVFFRSQDSENLEYLFKMALDLAFQHIWTDVGSFETLRPSQQMKAWASPGEVKCLEFFDGVKLTELPAGKTLVVTRCNDETVYVTTDATLKRDGWSYKHKCSIIAARRSSTGRGTHPGIRVRKVKSIVDLPLQYARRLLFDHLFPQYISNRSSYRKVR